MLNRHKNLVVSAVVERLFLLANTPFEQVFNCTPSDLVRAGFCDPIRLFVKQEPHPVRKLKEGRYRLISSVSLIDQLVERMLFGPQNQLEISEWANIPSKPGMGLSLQEQGDTIMRDLKVKHSWCPAAEADISGFDWTVQDWELWADVEMRIALGGFPYLLAKAARNRFACFMSSVFQLSNGELLEQLRPGIMKSGSYCTSSTNSRVRCLMAELIGSPWCIAMGDDSVEGFVEDARQKYEVLGHTCKDYVPCEVDECGELVSVNFCSHKIQEGNTYLETWPKTLFRHLASGSADYADIQAELAGNPKWRKIKWYLDSYLVRNTPSPDKIILGNVDCEKALNAEPVDPSARSDYDRGRGVIKDPQEPIEEGETQKACCSAGSAYPGWGIHCPSCPGFYYSD